MQASFQSYWLKDGTCNACRNPESIVTAIVKYQVTIQDGNEVTQLEVEAKAPRYAFEAVLNQMGYAPWKFDIRMDLDLSNTRRVIYTAKGAGDTVLQGLVKVI